MTTQNIAERVLQREAEEEALRLQTVTVRKQVPLEFDLGRLTATDLNLINLAAAAATRLQDDNNDDDAMDDEDDCDQKIKMEPNGDAPESADTSPRVLFERYLQRTARENVQLMLNSLWDLETKRVDGIVVATLPRPTTVLPRSKPPPKPRPPTKWEAFAKAKGIANKGRSKEKTVWDEVTQAWVPTHGYRRSRAEKAANWLREVPDNVTDPAADMYAKAADEKNERVAKNEFQRLRNIAKSTKTAMGVPPAASERPDLTKDEAAAAATYARTSTASVGKFDRDLKGEKAAKNLGKKRKFESNTQPSQVEKDKNLAIIDSLMSRQPKVDIERAVDSLLTRRGNSVKVSGDSSGRGGGSRGGSSKNEHRRSKAGGKSRGRPQGAFKGGKGAAAKGDGGSGGGGHRKSSGPFKKSPGGGGRGKPGSGGPGRKSGSGGPGRKPASGGGPGRKLGNKFGAKGKK